MRIPVLFFLFTVAVLAAAPAAAQRLEIIELLHRPAEEVIPLLRPFLAEGGTLTGQRSQLFVRTTPENLTELRRMLASIDTAPRQLLITVLQGEGIELAEDEAALRARLGGEMAAGARGDSVKLRVRRTRSRRRAEDVQRIRVTEGGSATIHVGQAVPLGARSTTQTPWGTQATDSIEYRTVTTGFAVVPRLNGDRVTLEISARRDAMASTGGGRIDVQGVRTTVTGKVGEWIALSGSAERDSGSGSGIIYRSTDVRETEGRVLIRVQRVP